MSSVSTHIALWLHQRRHGYQLYAVPRRRGHLRWTSIHCRRCNRVWSL